MEILPPLLLGVVIAFTVGVNKLTQLNYNMLHKLRPASLCSTSAHMLYCHLSPEMCVVRYWVIHQEGERYALRGENLLHSLRSQTVSQQSV